MPLLEHPDLRHGLARLTSGMLGFMDGGTASYSEDDIDRCRAILVSHAEALEHAKDRTAALELVKSTVTQLNTLNRDAGQDLIETDQREEICGFIIRARAIMGFNSEAEDVTEEWREWQGLTNRMQRTPRLRLGCILNIIGAGSLIRNVRRQTRVERGQRFF